MSLQATPLSDRIHIGIFGKRNSGKSSLINAITGQNIALVSDVAGTTTDPVYKTMELHPIGPCVFIDTAGFDDVETLGLMRVEKTRQAMEKTDIALVVFADDDFMREDEWISRMRERKIPIIPVINKADLLAGAGDLAKQIEERYHIPPVVISAKSGQGMDQLKNAIIRSIPENYGQRDITRHLVDPGDVVLLVMPQDIQAPKGRLILPQVQTIRSLLDNRCVVMSVTTDKLDVALGSLQKAPKLIITDSQVFPAVYKKKPEESLLTSFSVLMAAYKGDVEVFVEGARAIDALTPQSRVLIAEACTHEPLDGDIGRVKIPALLRKKVGQGLSVEVVNGVDFPKDLSPYDLVIHCGACMFNRRYVLTRIEAANEQGVPITNYGVAIAKLTGILDKITF